MPQEDLHSLMQEITSNVFSFYFFFFFNIVDMFSEQQAMRSMVFPFAYFSNEIAPTYSSFNWPVSKTISLDVQAP